MVTLQLNGRSTELTADPETPLLWVLRSELGLPGTKYGCGAGICGVCTLHIDGRASKACQVTLKEVSGRAITTIEGLVAAGHPVIDAWIAEQVPQCGYCQPAMVMAAAAALAQPGASEGAVGRAMSEVLCRCGSYTRARRALAQVGANSRRAASARMQLAPRPAATSHVLNPWVAIGDDGSVTVRIDRAEMGQGALTGIAILVAEELEVDLAQVRAEFAPVDRVYSNPMFGEQSTGGSTSIRSSYEPLRRAGAGARAMLVAAAATAWNVPIAECRADSGAVRHLPSNKVLAYGALAAKASKLVPPARVTLKERGSFRLIGTKVPRMELPAHVRGETVYGSDVRVPGMVYAVIQRPPGTDARLADADRSRAEATPGVVQVLEVPAGIAVVGDTPWSALSGRAALALRWKARAGFDSAAIMRAIAAGLAKSGRVGRASGDADTALKRADSVIEATYATPFQAHAPMEPMNCTVRLGARDGEIWVGTQSPADARAVAAEAAGLKPESIAVHTTFLGGSFGRRMDSDFVQEAVEVAKAVGRPVQLLWSRDDDMRHGSFRPANRAQMRGAVRGGRIEAIAMKVAGPGMSLDGINMLYDVPHYREEQVRVDVPVPTSAWRAVGASQNAFHVESFVDELASVAGTDPLAFRVAHLSAQPRLAGTLSLAAAKAGWSEPLPAGRGRGVACYRSFGSYVAIIVEVTVRPAGVPRVDRVVVVADCGIVVTPDAVAAQMEGAVIFALGATLLSEITFREGAVVEQSFADYPIVRFHEAPAVEVHLVPSNESPGGAGEPGVPPLAPAVANAFFAATGKRRRSLPIRS